MTGSIDYLDHFSSTSDLDEPVCFPLKCSKNISLSRIWIPAHLLSGDNSSKQVNQGIFHTLQKEDADKQIESFCVYIDSYEEDYSNVGEIFQSDSDEENVLSSESITSEENRNCTVQFLDTLDKTNIPLVKPNNCNKNDDLRNLYEHVMDTAKEEVAKTNANVCMNDLSLKPSTAVSDGYHNNSMKTENIPNVENAGNVPDSQISLNEILDTTPEINIKQFSFDYKKKDNEQFNNTLVKKKKLESKKRDSKKERQLKKKASKIFSLDETDEDYVYDDRLDRESYYRHVMSQAHRATYGIGLKNKVEFPDLNNDEIKFIKSDESYAKTSDKNLTEKSDKIHTEEFNKSHNEKSDKSRTEESHKSHTEKIAEAGLKSVIDVLMQSSENDENGNDCKEEMLLEDSSESTFGKIVIENIPLDVLEDDIYSILLGYGEIKSFTLKSTGTFLRASVEMDLICDIDWIVECLNGSEPFGSSTETLKCYNATESCV